MGNGAKLLTSGRILRHTYLEEYEVPFRLDYFSCVLTIASTILVGRRCWEGWILAAVNSVIICLIGFRTSQFGFIPANLFCIALYGVNLRSWRKPM
jgi:nicotinamide riboside transporter PnuC